MMNMMDNVDGMQNPIDGGGNAFANKAAFYDSVEQVASVAPVVPLDNFIGLTNIVYSDPLPTSTSPAILVNGTSYTVIDSINDQANSYQGFILLDKTTNSLFVVNRGSQEPGDFKTDAAMAVAAVNNRLRRHRVTSILRSSFDHRAKSEFP